MSMARPSRRRRVLSTLTLLAATAACAGAGVFAAFSATTDNTGNEITSGTVTLADNDAGQVLYTVANAAPGTSVTRCIQVTYTGSLRSEVRLYTPSTIGALGPYVDFEIQPGTQAAPSFADCAGFTADGAALFSGTLSGFAGAHGSWAGGVPVEPADWTNGQAVVFRVTATVRDDQAAAGLGTGAHALVWEARSR